MKRSATAVWHGTGKEGKGVISTQSGVLKNSHYAYVTRFENDPGTNPEELVAAAHAGCFSMKLSFNLTKAGFPPDTIETHCEVTLDPAQGKVTSSRLDVKVKAKGIDKTQFDQLVTDAEKNCPISKLLNTEITCTAELSN